MKLIFAAGIIAATVLFPVSALSQTTGGRAAFNFLRLPSSPLLTAAGGVNTSYAFGDVSVTANNPALLNPSLNEQLHAGFHSFFAKTKAYGLTSAFSLKDRQTTVGGHIHFIDHGTLPVTDAAGNVGGNFRPVDFVVQMSAAKGYLQKWTYGLTVKFIQSNYGQYRSSAVAVDVGVLFKDSAKNLSASLLVKNMGVQLKTYAGEAEDLPFDLQVGITKRLKEAPFAFSVTAQQLQTFEILYNDTTFNRENDFRSPSLFNKLLTHFVLASHLFLGQHLEATIGYNFLQRQELRVGTEGNGLTGFSAGLRVTFSKLQILYSRTTYQRGVASNQIGITVHLDRLGGFGR
ncbi:MAG TPA: type IX secretion system protein PorQ [Flavisolibacter sp.]|jgi:hypothetical protein|nr:type IX secretion system protein PorQ [Flavisolibacter sp.]